MPANNNYKENVFINCPFDNKYKNKLNAIIFTIFDCGFYPRCALEEDDSSQIRIEKIYKIIESCQYGIHDISRTQLDKNNKLPRFNMPLELGVFLGAKRFGNIQNLKKKCLIIDIKDYRYQKFISDISGQDVKSHENKIEKLIEVIRNWLNNQSKNTKIPTGDHIFKKYQKFKRELPLISKADNKKASNLTYKDFCIVISVWLQANNTI